MRPCIIFEWSNKGFKEIGPATFHQFGTSYEEFYEGPAMFSSAIVEMPDGTVKNLPCENIRFIDKD